MERDVAEAHGAVSTEPSAACLAVDDAAGNAAAGAADRKGILQ